MSQPVTVIKGTIEINEEKVQVPQPQPQPSLMSELDSISFLGGQP